VAKIPGLGRSEAAWQLRTRMSRPVSSPGSGSDWPVLAEECLEAVVGGGL